MNLNLVKSQFARTVLTVGCGQPSGCVRCGLRTLMTSRCGPALSGLILYKSRLKPIAYAVRRPVMSVSSHSSTSVSIRNTSSKSGQQSDTESSDSDMLSTESDDEDLFHEPPKVRFGLIKVALTIALGIYAGALFAMFGANFLEEFEIFVKDEEEDDE